MLAHYLKIAFRNLRKYKMQTIISIIGLAVGFVCFALSALWIRYERSFDTHHPNARNMYVITLPDIQSPHGFFQRTPEPLATYLKATFPEVKNAAHTFQSHTSYITWNEKEIRITSLMVLNPSIFDLFNIRVLQGHLEFSGFAQRHLAISASKARRLFGDKNPIGETFAYSKIVAVVSDLPRPSSFQFDIISLMRDEMILTGWNFSAGSTIIELHPNVNKEAFFDRLRNHTIERGEHERLHIRGMDVIPLTRMRYQDPNVQEQRNVKYEYILLFSLVGFLVILCSLFNYFTLFFSRFRIRKKEFALRMVCGATFKSLFSLLATEFLSIILLASLLGLVMVYLFQSIFLELSEIDMPLSAVFVEILLYWLGIILLALLSFFVLLLIFRKQSLNASIRRSKNAISRKVSVVIQLIISIIFAFCTIVMIKQLNDLTQPGNLGFEFQNTASFAVAISAPGDTPPAAMTLYHQLMQMPGIEEVVFGFPSLLPQWHHISRRNINRWEGQREDDEGFDIRAIRVSEAFINFYRFQLVEGEFLTDYDRSVVTVLINEEAKRRLGWTEAVGKTFSGHTVKGVIRNIQAHSPTVSVSPTLYYVNNDVEITTHLVIFRYQGVSFFDMQRRIEAFFAEEYPHFRPANFNDASAVFAELIQSERSLMKLLGFASLVCILISIFGFFSLVSLTCEERRKEIAIRKINGATIHDIVGIFFKEYALLLAIGALIAFPIGYYIMQRWLEQYVLQTAIPMWIYVAILLALTLVIVSCVGWRVWKASVENPADVVKSE